MTQSTKDPELIIEHSNVPPNVSQKDLVQEYEAAEPSSKPSISQITPIAHIKEDEGNSVFPNDSVQVPYTALTMEDEDLKSEQNTRDSSCCKETESGKLSLQPLLIEENMKI